VNSLQKGLATTAVHVAIVLAVAGKYYVDRGSLPRVWARGAPYDPNLPIRGRYVRLSIRAVLAAGTQSPDYVSTVTLRPENGRLVAMASEHGGLSARFDAASSTWALTDAIAFFIPEHAPDPSIRPADEELWVEVSVPKKGPPRPVRLGVKKNGVLTPLNLD